MELGHHDGTHAFASGAVTVGEHAKVVGGDVVPTGPAHVMQRVVGQQDEAPRVQFVVDVLGRRRRAVAHQPIALPTECNLTSSDEFTKMARYYRTNCVQGFILQEKGNRKR